MFNKKDFRARKDDIISYFQRNEVVRDNITEFCVLSGIPITVVCEYIMDDMSQHRTLCIEIIKDLNKFYGIKEKTCGSCSRRCYQSHCILEE